jgi:rhamnosyltransferase
VVTYHPIPEHLDNIRTLRSQVDQVIVVDNASNADEVEGLRSLQAELALVLVENHENMGIGYALNQGVRWALEHDYKWINTFDQDSCVTEGYMRAMIEDFEQLATEMPLGLLVPRYRDPLTGEFRRFRTEGHLGPFVTITSGSLFPADVIRTCGPFVEELFMYGIDDEYSLRLRQRGFEIAQSKKALLLHLDGASRVVRGFGRELFTVTNHSALARYYANRNRFWLIRRYARSYPLWCMRLALDGVKETVKVVAAERQKRIKLVRIFQGIKDGMFGRTGKTHLS